MKQIYSMVIAALCLALSAGTAEAQWSDLAPVFEQLDSTERANFLENLDALQESWHYGSIELGSIVDSLANGLSVYDPTAPVDSMLMAWSANRNDLLAMLDSSNLDMPDSLALIMEYDRVNDIWNMNLDSLNAVLELYSDSTVFSPGLADEAVQRFEVFEGLWTQSFNQLQESLKHGFNLTEPEGINELQEVVDTLFSSMFDLELAYGQEFVDARYYGEAYSVVASAIRLGSVPQFDRPWEARWHVKGSFFFADEEFAEETSSFIEGLNGLLCDGQFALMYNPMITCTNGITFRLYSSLGMEVSTYVPAHVTPGLEETRDNVGNTTGYGPQMAAGMIVNVGSTTLYTFGTLAQGDVFNSPDYEFRARSVNAGLRIGNAVNILYSHGRSR